MHTYNLGDKSAGICETCKKQVSTRLDAISYEINGKVIPDLPVFVCTVCGTSVGIPHSSALLTHQR